MRLCFITTYPPARCGIGDYTFQLVNAARSSAPENEIHILAEYSGHPDEIKKDKANPPDNIHYCWSREKNWEEEICSALDRIVPDIVHIQHEEAIFGQNDRFVSLVRKIHARKIKCVITLHSVYDKKNFWMIRQWPPHKFHLELAKACDKIVVHQKQGMYDKLILHGVSEDKICVIAHGTPTVILPDKDSARSRLNLSKHKKLALFLGFIHPKKGVHTVVRAFREVNLKLPNTQLVVAGNPRRRNIFDTFYQAWLSRLMEVGREEGWLHFHNAYLTHDEMLTYLAACDLVLLPHQQDYGSASGILHLALGGGRPVLCSKGNKFSELYLETVQNGMFDFPEASNVPEWSRSIISLLGNEDRLSAAADFSRSLGETTSWTNTTRKHWSMYREVL